MVRPWLGTVDPRAGGEALPCAQIALVLSVLGTVGIGAILSMGGVTLYGGIAFPKHAVAAIVVVLLAQLSDRHRAVGALLRIPG
jgi:hypothetical protein